MKSKKSKERISNLSRHELALYLWVANYQEKGISTFVASQLGDAPSGTWNRSENDQGSQQLMLGQNGLCHNSPHTAGPNDTHKRGDRMNEEDYEIAHALSYQLPIP